MPSARSFLGISLNTALVRDKWNLAQSIEGAVRNGYTGIAPARAEVDAMGARAFFRHVRDSQLAVTSLNPSHLTPIDRDTSIEEMLLDLKRAIQQTADIGANCLTVVAGGMSKVESNLKDLHNKFRDILESISEFSDECGVRIALEPLHPVFCPHRSIICDVSHVVQLISELGPRFGIAIDSYHVWWNWKLKSELAAIDSERIHIVHINDWLLEPVDRLIDRGFPGEGVIDIENFMKLVNSTGYDRFIEVEIFSKRHERMDPNAAISLAYLKTCDLLDKAEINK